MSLFSSVSPKAQKLITAQLEKYCESAMNYSVDHLMPYGKKQSPGAADQLKAEMREILFPIAKEKTTETVEVPVRNIEPNL
jgi:hypothetical protein